MELETIGELMGRKYPQQEWVVEGLFPAAATSIISGPPANFKTWVLLELAHQVAKGGKVFGYFQTLKTNVLIIDEESGARLLQQRLRKLDVSEGLGIYFYHKGDFTLSTESAQKLVEACRQHEVGMVIIDSLVRVHGGDENKSGDMARVFDHIKALNTAEIAVVLTHHNRKPGVNTQNSASDMRGSSDILASIDAHLSLSRKADVLHFHQTKQRYAEELEPFKVHIVEEETMTLQYGGSSKNDDAYKLKGEIIELLLAAPNTNQQQIGELLNIAGTHVNEHKLRKVLKELVTERRIVQERGVGKTLLYTLAKLEDETE